MTMEETLTFDFPKLIEEIAGPMRPRDNRQSWLDRAAKESKLSYSRIKSLFYEECKDPPTSITIRVLMAVDKARREAAELATQFETLAGSLNAQENSDRHSSDVLALINAARALRGMDRA